MVGGRGGCWVKAGTGRLPKTMPRGPRASLELVSTTPLPPRQRPSTALPSPDVLQASWATPPAHGMTWAGRGGSSESPDLLGSPGRDQRHRKGVAESWLRPACVRRCQHPGPAQSAVLRPGAGPAPLPRAARATREDMVCAAAPLSSRCGHTVLTSTTGPPSRPADEERGSGTGWPSPSLRRATRSAARLSAPDAPNTFHPYKDPPTPHPPPPTPPPRPARVARHRAPDTDPRCPAVTPTVGTDARAGS